ncbi:putative xylose isomerase, Zinc transporter 9 [Helianthus anomalus]
MNKHIFSQGTKIRPLWGTTQLFMHPRYMHGGATSPEIGVYAYAVAQVKKAIERNRMPLIGRAIDDHDMKRVVDSVYDCKSEVIKPGFFRFKAEIDFNGVTLVQNYLSRTRPKEWAKKFRNDAKEKDDAEMLKIMSFYGEEVVTALGSEVDRLEKNRSWH